MPTLSLDRTGRKILDRLQKDGRRSNLELAERVNLSPSPVLRRVRALEEAGLIKQYVALLDPLKLGLGLPAYVTVKLEKKAARRSRHSPARCRPGLKWWSVIR